MSENQKNNKLLQIAVWILAVIAVLVVLLISIWGFVKKPVTSKEKEYSQVITVSSGESLKSVAKDLKQNKLIYSSNALYLAAKFNLFHEKHPFGLKAGIYLVKSSMNLKQIYQLLESGRADNIVVTIPEGLTKSKIAEILEENKVCGKDEFIQACFDKNHMREYNINAENFEGYLYPDTYYFSPGMKAEDVIDIMVQNFYAKISEIPGFKDMSARKLHDTLILASIVEKEYLVADEAPVIASVFSNRLRHGIGLYSCATILYIVEELQGQSHPEIVTYEHTHIDSPYNTYLYAGLTPGPISNPGSVALNAAANPAKTDYYFFVTKKDGSGRHTFSKTFDEHKVAEGKE